MCMYVLGLIELELSLKLWFWLNNENSRKSMFQYLESSIYVHLLIMNNNIAICNHYDMVSMMWSFQMLSFRSRLGGGDGMEWKE